MERLEYCTKREWWEREERNRERKERWTEWALFWTTVFQSSLSHILQQQSVRQQHVKTNNHFFQTVGPCSGQSRGFLKHGVISPVEYVLAHPRSCLRTSRASQHISVHWTDLSLCSELWHSARAHPRLCALTPGYLHVCQSVVQCHQWETIIKAKSLFL